MTFLQLNSTQSYIATLKHRIDKKIETICTYRVDFEVVEIDD